jgi:hypothetical protein
VHVLEEFSAQDLRRLELARDRLSAYLLSTEAFQFGHQPAAGSPFLLGTRENGGIWWRETGDLALAASFDHLLAFNTLVRGAGLPRQAGYSVLRGCAEAAAIAWWLFDPTATEEQRVQRGFEERLYGIHTQRGIVEKNRAKLAAIHAALVTEAARHGLTEQPDSRKEGLTTFGRPRLSIQDLLTRMLPTTPPNSELTNGEVLWRLLSAFSHSEHWTSVAGLPEVEDDTKPRRLVVNLNTLFGSALMTLAAHDLAFGRRMSLAGHSTWEQTRGHLPDL